MTSRKMKFQLKKIKDCRHSLKVEVDSARIEARFEEVLKEFQKKAKIKGFREGKVPLDIVKTTFAKEADEEVVKSLIGETYYACVRESRITPVGMPDIKDLKLERGKRLSFTAEFEGVPDFSVRNYKGVRVNRRKEAVSDADIEKALASLRESRSELEPVALIRPVMEGDVVRCDVEVHKEGSYAPAQKGVLIAVDRQRTHADLCDQILGVQIDETRDITAEFSEEEKAQGLVGRKPVYRLTVRGIQTKKLPELDDAFASGFGKANMDELKAEIRRDMETMRREEADERLKNEIYETLLKSNGFEVPESLVVRQKERLLEQSGIAPSSNGHDKPPAAVAVEAEAMEKAAKQIRLYFILEKIADAERIEPSEAEVEERLRLLAERAKQSVEEVREMYEEDVYQNLRHARTTDFLVKHANVKEEAP